MSQIKQELAGQTIVVTGSSSGIGRAIAIELAGAGADVLVHARSNRQGAQETVDAIKHAGSQSHAILADLADPAGQDRLVEEAWGWRGSVNVWINNAGADVLTGEQQQTFEQKLQQLLEVDVTATLRLSRDAGQRMKQQGHGIILNMGWDQAEVGMEGDSGEMFAAAKGAVMAATRSLARSLAPEVRVNCLAPGWIRTTWAKGASQAWQQRAEKECLLGRWGEVEDVARTARFLCSPASSFITGQIIAVNGGFAGPSTS
jgi:3-oxoacyl-[acyl-carrier protein] reductase